MVVACSSSSLLIAIVLDTYPHLAHRRRLLIATAFYRHRCLAINKSVTFQSNQMMQNVVRGIASSGISIPNVREIVLSDILNPIVADNQLIFGSAKSVEVIANKEHDCTISSVDKTINMDLDSKLQSEPDRKQNSVDDKPDFDEVRSTELSINSELTFGCDHIANSEWRILNMNLGALSTDSPVHQDAISYDFQVLNALSELGNNLMFDSVNEVQNSSFKPPCDSSNGQMVIDLE
ncbi:hypothetical protein L2E82_50526 [Cichorium intybus]|nr:hypothetical protein L2E82_50526 [Cichorium intybus]